MSAFKEGDPTTLNRLYGRSQGKPLRASQQDLVDRLLPQISVPDEGPVTSETLFGFDRPLHFEIGFGGGEHLAERADLLPDHGFIGAEPFVNGVAQALTHVRDRTLANVRIHHGDALEVLRRVPDGALTMVYLLHPDPWPKTRHHKRRFVSDGTVAAIARVLKCVENSRKEHHRDDNEIDNPAAPHMSRSPEKKAQDGPCQHDTGEQISAGNQPR